MPGPTHKSTWKARERQAAALFGSKRQRCSGSSGREDCSRSDSTNPVIFLETKLKAQNATVTLYDETRILARKEGKIPVLALCVKYRTGTLLVIEPDDLLVVANEYKLAREAVTD